METFNLTRVLIKNFQFIRSYNKYDIYNWTIDSHNHASILLSQGWPIVAHQSDTQDETHQRVIFQVHI